METKTIAILAVILAGVSVLASFSEKVSSPDTPKMAEKLPPGMVATVHVPRGYFGLLTDMEPTEECPASRAKADGGCLLGVLHSGRYFLPFERYHVEYYSIYQMEKLSKRFPPKPIEIQQIPNEEMP